jgi:hypothetical protein
MIMVRQNGDKNTRVEVGIAELALLLYFVTTTRISMYEVLRRECWSLGTVVLIYVVPNDKRRKAADLSFVGYHR